MSNKEETKPSVIQDPIVPHDKYTVSACYENNIIPGPPIKIWSLFDKIWEAPNDLPLKTKKQTLIYIYNIIEKVYGPEYSPRSNFRVRYDIGKHVEAFILEDRNNKKGCYHNTNREQVISRKLFSCTIRTFGRLETRMSMVTPKLNRTPNGKRNTRRHSKLCLLRNHTCIYATIGFFQKIPHYS